MAYRRRQQIGTDSTFGEDNGAPYNQPPTEDDDDGVSLPSASSLAAKAIRASSAHRDSSLSSAYGQSALSSPRDAPSSPSSAKVSSSYEYSSMKSLHEPKQGFWGTLARKARSIIDEDNVSPEKETLRKTRLQSSGGATKGQYDRTNQDAESCSKTNNPNFQTGLDAIASSLNYIGGTIGNALEEGLTVVENRTADIIQETRKLQIRKKESDSIPLNQNSNFCNSWQQPMAQSRVKPRMQADLEIQMKASRDVAMAMAAKAKLLLRELKTVKADLAFAKERCAQLEEENRILRGSRDKGDNAEDDDLIRLQLETLLAEKARLAQENSVFARENRFLREIVEYHQLTMQDVVYFDEGNEEVTEVYPIKSPSGSSLQPLGTSPTLLPHSSQPPISLMSPMSPYDLHSQNAPFHSLASSEPNTSLSGTSPCSRTHMADESPERH